MGIYSSTLAPVIVLCDKISSSKDGGECPVHSSSQTFMKENQKIKKRDKKSHSKAYDVYGREIDLTNNMPTNPNNQKLYPTQKFDLSKNRQASSIPKGGRVEDDTTWTYPSPQMFFNALERKNKGLKTDEKMNEDDEEEDMEVVGEDDVNTIVQIHNNMNEKTWKKVMAWESLRNEGENLDFDQQPSSSSLVKFKGRPSDLSPKAYFKMIFGHPPPFDRHDWIVEKDHQNDENQENNQSQMRYIIDYYHDSSLSNQDSLPISMKDESSISSIKMDVRPALDSLESFIMRCWLMPFKRWRNSSITFFEPLPFFSSEEMRKSFKIEQEEQEKLEQKEEEKKRKSNKETMNFPSNDKNNNKKEEKEDEEVYTPIIPGLDTRIQEKTKKKLDEKSWIQSIKEFIFGYQSSIPKDEKERNEQRNRNLQRNVGDEKGRDEEEDDDLGYIMNSISSNKNDQNNELENEALRWLLKYRMIQKKCSPINQKISTLRKNQENSKEENEMMIEKYEMKYLVCCNQELNPTLVSNFLSQLSSSSSSSSVGEQKEEMEEEKLNKMMQEMSQEIYNFENERILKKYDQFESFQQSISSSKSKSKEKEEE